MFVWDSTIRKDKDGDASPCIRCGCHFKDGDLWYYDRSENGGVCRKCVGPEKLREHFELYGEV